MMMEMLSFMTMKPIIILKIIINCFGIKKSIIIGLLTLGLNYTYGRGYYEQYKEDEDFEFYDFESH